MTLRKPHPLIGHRVLVMGSAHRFRLVNIAAKVTDVSTTQVQVQYEYDSTLEAPIDWVDASLIELILTTETLESWIERQE
jgi:hypothetical protein